MKTCTETTLRNEILKAAKELFTRNGFDNTTLAELTDKVQIDSPSFYCYFRSMDDLLETIWSES